MAFADVLVWFAVVAFGVVLWRLQLCCCVAVVAFAVILLLLLLCCGVCSCSASFAFEAFAVVWWRCSCVAALQLCRGVYSCAVSFAVVPFAVVLWRLLLCCRVCYCVVVCAFEFSVKALLLECKRQVSPPSRQCGSRAVYRYIDTRWGRFGLGLLDGGRAGVKAGNQSVARRGFLWFQVRRGRGEEQICNFTAMDINRSAAGR